MLTTQKISSSRASSLRLQDDRQHFHGAGPVIGSMGRDVPFG